MHGSVVQGVGAASGLRPEGQCAWRPTSAAPNRLLPQVEEDDAKARQYLRQALLLERLVDLVVICNHVRVPIDGLSL